MVLRTLRNAGWCGSDPVCLETDPGHVERVREAAERAERRCLITGALECPVRIRVDAGASPTKSASGGAGGMTTSSGRKR